LGKSVKEINLSGNILKTNSCPFNIEDGANLVLTLKSKNANLNGYLFGTTNNANITIKSVNITCDELKANQTFNGAGYTIENLTLDCNKASFGVLTITGTHVKNLYFKGTKEKWQQFKFDSGWITNDAVKVVHCTDGELALQ
jgi:hypothetical protein